MSASGTHPSSLSKPDTAEVIFYTRAGCCLCDEAKRLLRDIQKKVPFDIREVDIDSDPNLRRNYNDEVPVIFIHGKKAFKYRVDPRQFLKRLEAGRA